MHPSTLHALVAVFLFFCNTKLCSFYCIETSLRPDCERNQLFYILTCYFDRNSEVEESQCEYSLLYFHLTIIRYEITVLQCLHLQPTLEALRSRRRQYKVSLSKNKYHCRIVIFLIILLETNLLIVMNKLFVADYKK